MRNTKSIDRLRTATVLIKSICCLHKQFPFFYIEIKGEYLDYQPIILCTLRKYRNFQIQKRSKHIAPGSIGFFVKCSIFKKSQFRRKRSISSISSAASRFATSFSSSYVISQTVSTKCDFYFIFALLWLGVRALTSRVHISLRAGQLPLRNRDAGGMLTSSKFSRHFALLTFFGLYMENLNKGNTSLSEFHTHGFFWAAILAQTRHSDFSVTLNCSCSILISKT